MSSAREWIMALESVGQWPFALIGWNLANHHRLIAPPLAAHRLPLTAYRLPLTAYSVTKTPPSAIATARPSGSLSISSTDSSKTGMVG